MSVLLRPAYPIFVVLFVLLSGNSLCQGTVIDRELSILKSKNLLTDWLVLRMSFAAEEPGERMEFLMKTEKELWREPVSEEEKETWLNLLLNRGYYLLYNGNIIGSIDQYEKANAYYEKNPVSGFDVAEYLFKPLGNNYTRLGDYSSAIYIQKKGLDFALSNSDSSGAASFYNNLAIAYRWLGEQEKAKEMVRLGSGMLIRKDGVYALLSNTMADILFEQGRIEEAEENINNSIRILTANNQSGNQYWLLSAYTLKGDIALKKRQYDKSLHYYEKGLALIEKFFPDGRRREKANLLNQKGNVYLIERDGKSALRCFNRSLEALIKGYNSSVEETPSLKLLYAENRLFDAMEGRGRAYLFLGREEKALADMLLALQSGDLSRNLISSVSDKIYYQQNYRRTAETAMETAYHLWRKDQKAGYAEVMLQLAEQSKARALTDDILKNQQQLITTTGDTLFTRRGQLQQAIVQYDVELASAPHNRDILLRNKDHTAYELAMIEKEIARKYPLLKSEANLLATDTGDLLKKIPEGLLVFNYFMGNKTGYNIILKKGEVSDVILLKNTGTLRSRIERFVTRFFRQGPSEMMNHPEIFYEESRSLRESLAPKNIFDEKQRLLVIPDDVIGYLSFESFILDGAYSENIRTWPFLIRKASVSYAYSLNTWMVPVHRNDQNGFSGFFISDGGKDRVELPAARLEQEYLASEVKGSFFINGQAGLRELKHAIAKSGVLHISTHSFPSGEDHVPVLEMADGNYFLFELSSGEKAPGLVVLSACRTADGLLASGEGVLSLSRGFAAAGTNGTVAGLWNVNDRAAAEQMAAFYRNLSKTNDPEKALYEMKIDWLQRQHSNPVMLLPYYWAELIYTGKPMKVKLQRPVLPQKKTGMIIIGSALFLLVMLFLLRKMRKKRAI